MALFKSIFGNTIELYLDNWIQEEKSKSIIIPKPS